MADIALVVAVCARMVGSGERVPDSSVHRGQNRGGWTLDLGRKSGWGLEQWDMA